MNDLRCQYLHALGIPVWVSRARPGPALGPAGRIRLGPGTGAHLFVCESPQESASLLAADLARGLAEPPVWSWPEDHPDALDLAVAVDERLISSVTVFGDALATALVGTGRPDTIGSAHLHVAPSLAELGGSGGQRRNFWKHLARIAARNGS